MNFLTNIKLQPILKWAGGKRQLLHYIREHYPKNYNTYFEPFLGAGAVLFDLQPKKAIVNDINSELINIYKIIKNEETVHKLIEILSVYENDEKLFYNIRNLDRLPIYKYLDPTIKASRVIFLNKTCYNGLYRVNKKGQFNVPFGKYKNPNIVNKNAILKMHNYFNSSDITFLNSDFTYVLSKAKKGDFIYLDPPYDPVNESSFTSYDNNDFDREDQKRLHHTFVSLDKKGCKVLLSNSSTRYIAELYKNYRIIEVPAKRSINSNPQKRGNVLEVLIKNYE